MTLKVSDLKLEWERLKPIGSGYKIIEIFGDAAMHCWEGAEALIDAYLELEHDTGERPNRKNINDTLYFQLKEYWGNNRIVEELKKLDEFISRIKQ